MNNKIRRTIMIFPEFQNHQFIDQLREKYDPLARHVRPHITLVFTFESELDSDVIKEHMLSTLQGIRAFPLKMGNVISVDNDLGKYLFLTIEEGTKEIREISKKLYSGILEEFKPNWLTDETFLPHMTLGVFSKREELELAFREAQEMDCSFYTEVEKLSLEIIADNEDSIIDLEINLSQ